jgi:4-hydroxy-3-polyprenylbenzoate decarboxylase
LVLADEKANICNYEQLAQQVFKNLNPATDVYFSQGPMDVLDHSCSKIGFGGKMCIDGTFKFDEEKDGNYELRMKNQELRIKESLNSFSEIQGVNDSLLKKDIAVLILSVEKNRRGHIKELHKKISSLKELEGIKMIVYVEHTVNANDLPVALWRFCNNLDPKRDHIISEREGKFDCIGLDGTRKTKEHDDFQRDWPNIIVADDETIKAVDEKWNSLGIGECLSSPSLKFKEQMYGEEAVVK